MKTIWIIRYTGSLIRIIGYILGLYRDNGKESGNYYNGITWGLGIMEKDIETTIAIVFRGSIGRMEKKMEIAVVYRGCVGRMEHVNYYSRGKGWDLIRVKGLVVLSRASSGPYNVYKCQRSPLYTPLNPKPQTLSRAPPSQWRPKYRCQKQAQRQSLQKGDSATESFRDKPYLPSLGVPQQSY